MDEATEAALMRAGAQIEQLQRELSAALARVEALEKDAARYRWLRDAPSHSAPTGSLVELWLFSRPTATAQAFDAAIDTAIIQSVRTPA